MLSSHQRIPGWHVVEDLKTRGTVEAIERAIIEADKIMIQIARNAIRVKAADDDERVLQVFQKHAAQLTSVREIAQLLYTQPGYRLSDTYRGLDVLDRYEAMIADVLNAPIVSSYESTHITRLRIWYFLYKKRLQRVAVKILIGVGVLLFITDTPMGRSLLGFVVEQIHALIVFAILLLVAILAAFALFVMSASLVDRMRSKKKRRY